MTGRKLDFAITYLFECWRQGGQGIHPHAAGDDDNVEGGQEFEEPVKDGVVLEQGVETPRVDHQTDDDAQQHQQTEEQLLVGGVTRLFDARCPRGIVARLVEQTRLCC